MTVDGWQLAEIIFGYTLQLVFYDQLSNSSFRTSHKEYLFIGILRRRERPRANDQQQISHFAQVAVNIKFLLLRSK
jgi:hypothetical protein